MFTPEPQPHAENSGNDNSDPKGQNQAPTQSGFWRNPNHWVAIATVVIAVANGLYTFFALQQWTTMKRTLEEMQRSGGAATDQAWRIIDNMNWLARTMDGSLQQTRRALGESATQNRNLTESARAANRMTEESVRGRIAIRNAHLRS